MDEAIEAAKSSAERVGPDYYYRFNRGHPTFRTRDWKNPETRVSSTEAMHRRQLRPDQSILSQIKHPGIYPELSWLANQFGKIEIFRDWRFGKDSAAKLPAPADLPDDRLLQNGENLALIVNRLEQHDVEYSNFNALLKRFFPRFKRMSTKIFGNGIQLFLHETGFSTPIPATRISDGTMRFIATVATLLLPEPPPIICIDGPELGLHPDAVSLVAELILKTSERTQIVVATHSDAFVSKLSGKPGAVVACERVGEETELSRLETEAISEFLMDYALGDLWRMGKLGANP